MSIFMHGTIRNQVQMKALNVKWELSKNKIHIGKDEKKPLSERERLIQRFHEECENNKKSEIYNKIYSKIKSGKKLSSEEINGKNSTAADEKGEKIHKPKKKKPVSFTEVSSELSLIISKISIAPSDIQSQSGYTKSV